MKNNENKLSKHVFHQIYVQPIIFSNQIHHIQIIYNNQIKQNYEKNYKTKRNQTPKQIIVIFNKRKT